MCYAASNRIGITLHSRKQFSPCRRKLWRFYFSEIHPFQFRFTNEEILSSLSNCNCLSFRRRKYKKAFKTCLHLKVLHCISTRNFLNSLNLSFSKLQNFCFKILFQCFFSVNKRMFKSIRGLAIHFK